MTTIRARQNSDDALCAARAFGRRYALASRLYWLRIGGGLAIGTAAIALALAGSRGSGEYVAALAALWLFVGRAGSQRLERHLRRQGALSQEAFDTSVLALPWNAAAAGEEPALEDLRNWGHRNDGAGLRDWYPDTHPAAPPVDALICQRSTITWARQDHTVFAWIAYGIATAGVALTVVVGVALNMDLGEYLLRAGLPLLPLVLDLIDVGDQNRQIAAMKRRAERSATDLYLEACERGVPPTTADCRELQDQILSTRLLPGVPRPFYRLTRARRQENMEDSAAAQAQRLPVALQLPELAEAR